MSERRAGASGDDVAVRSRSAVRRGPSASPGLPEAEGDQRLAELEDRLARLEGEPSLRERGRRMADRIMPPEASRHFRNAGREQLLGVRAIVDFWIRRIDNAEDRARTESGRETIEID